MHSRIFSNLGPTYVPTSLSTTVDTMSHKPGDTGIFLILYYELHNLNCQWENVLLICEQTQTGLLFVLERTLAYTKLTGVGMCSNLTLCAFPQWRSREPIFLLELKSISF